MTAKPMDLREVVAMQIMSARSEGRGPIGQADATIAAVLGAMRDMPVPLLRQIADDCGPIGCCNPDEHDIDEIVSKALTTFASQNNVGIGE